MNEITNYLLLQWNPWKRISRQPPSDGLFAARRDAGFPRSGRIGRFFQQEPQQQLRQFPPDDTHLRRADLDSADPRPDAQNGPALLLDFDAGQPRHIGKLQRFEGQSQGIAG